MSYPTRTIPLSPVLLTCSQAWRLAGALQFNDSEYYYLVKFNKAVSAFQIAIHDRQLKLVGYYQPARGGL